MLAHWLVARHIKAVTTWIVLPLEVTTEFWKTWHDVYRGGTQ